jgi:hypothetical protein
MPWKRAKALGPPDNTLFWTCWRLQHEAIEATRRTCRDCSGETVTRGGCRCETCDGCGWTERFIPLIVENVQGAQRWVGRARWHFGSYYLWGDVPALMPPVLKAQKRNPDGTHHGPGSWFAIADSKNRGSGQKMPAWNCSPLMWKDREIARYAHPTATEYEKHGFGESGRKVAMNFHEHEKTGKPGRSLQSVAVEETKSNSRKAASAQIAKIPFPLAQWIARVYKPDSANAASPARPDPREERQHKELEELRKFQAECMVDFRGPEGDWCHTDGAWMGMADALAEECLILKEMKDRGMK